MIYQISESSRACVCGHVIEDANRYIGGKRFSGQYKNRNRILNEGKFKINFSIRYLFSSACAVYRHDLINFCLRLNRISSCALFKTGK